MSYVDAAKVGYKPVGGKWSEWVLLDEQGRHRFATEGDRHLPGSGMQWKPVKREYAQFKVGQAVRTNEHIEGFWEENDSGIIHALHNNTDLREEAPLSVKLDTSGRTIRTQAWRLSHIWTNVGDTKPVMEKPNIIDQDSSFKENMFRHYDTVDDDAFSDDPVDQLPWQVVGIYSQTSFDDFKRQYFEYKASLQEAINSVQESLPALPPVLPQKNDQEHSSSKYNKQLGILLAKAKEACETDHITAHDGLMFLNEVLDGNNFTILLQQNATLHVEFLASRARCHRRLGHVVAAIVDCQHGLVINPRDEDILFEQALTLLDAARPDEAVVAFEALLQASQASFSGIERWLVHAHARARRRDRDPAAYSEGIFIGSKVETLAAYPGLWESHEQAVVVGLGPPNAPIEIEFLSPKRRVNTQAFRISLIDDLRVLESTNDDPVCIHSQCNHEADRSAEDWSLILEQKRK